MQDKKFIMNNLIDPMKTIIKNIFFNSNICILGMDGTGKTTTIVRLREELQRKSQIQYMGFRNHVTYLAKKRFNENDKYLKNSIFSKSINLIVSYIEMWCRVFPHWFHDYIVIYDRYAWGVYTNSTGISRRIGVLFFKYLFSKPKHVFYLYCPTEESLKRKDDILDLEEFKTMKERFDDLYLNSKSVVAINTMENDVESIIEIILNDIKIASSTG